MRKRASFSSGQNLTLRLARVARSSLFLSEFVVRGLDQLQQIFSRQSELFCFDRKLHGQRLEAAQFFRSEQPRALVIDVAAASAHGAEDAIALQVLVGPG